MSIADGQEITVEADGFYTAAARVASPQPTMAFASGNVNPNRFVSMPVGVPGSAPAQGNPLVMKLDPVVQEILEEYKRRKPC